MFNLNLRPILTDQMQRLASVTPRLPAHRLSKFPDAYIQAGRCAGIDRTDLVDRVELTDYPAQEQEDLRRWIESARAQAGMDPKIPERAAAAADVSEEPRKPIDGQVQLEIRLIVNRSEPTVVTQTVRNGESFTIEAADGLIAEATPTLYDDHWLDVRMTYYEQGAAGKRRLDGGGSFGVQTRMPDGTPNRGGGGRTVITGRKGYAIETMISATAL